MSAPTSNKVQEIQATVEQFRDQFEEHLEKIPADDYTEAALRARIREFGESPAGNALTQALEEATTNRDRLQADVDRSLKSLSPAGDAAQESRNTRTWARARRVLDNTSDGNLGAMAASMIERADDSELGVLAQELRSYIDSRGQEGMAVLGRVQFDLAIQKRAPQYADAITRATEAEKARQVTLANVTALRKAVNELHHPKAYRKPQIIDAVKLSSAKRRTVL